MDWIRRAVLDDSHVNYVNILAKRNPEKS